MINPEINWTKNRDVKVSYVVPQEGEHQRPYLDVKLITHDPLKGRKRGMTISNRFSINESIDIQKKVRECLQRHCIALKKTRS